MCSIWRSWNSLPGCLHPPYGTPTFLRLCRDLAILNPMADWQHLLQLGQQFQGRLQELQRNLAERTFEGQAGGGLVRVAVDGKGTVLSVQIAPEVFDGHDAEFLSDLLLGAVAEAQRRASDALQGEMRKMGPLPFNVPL
jgi:nucleoid-associated protein EbfC